MTTPEHSAPETERRVPLDRPVTGLDGRATGERRIADRRTVDRRGSRAITPLMGTPIAENDWIGFPLKPRQLTAVVRSALQEDGALNDLTTIACVYSDRRAHGTIVASRGGVIAGVPLAIAAFRVLDPNVAIRVDVDDGGYVAAGSVVMRITGLARAILSAERVALNYLQRLSGVATTTARYVAAVRGTHAHIYDTRRTTPGMRELECYAVRAGGGLNHRFDPTRAVRVRLSHLAAVGRDVTLAVRRAREFVPPGSPVAVECRTTEQVRQAIDARADTVVLMGMSPSQARECVELVGGRAATELYGPIATDEVRAYAQAGVDRIAVPALTQCAAALELSLEFEAM
ncbi:MAG TPA: carboxylating nicotinate-nucleotide diphosphorylase [Gemmatimonadaceae bacterium]|nr:carboxylating nicotinate-nucleotide diphosphorylase [Gemmatimonadaceae bacterium]